MKNCPQNCPFNHKECTKECALFVDPEELNEAVRNKLASVGVMNRDKGMCAFKNLSLCLNRMLYEELT